MWISHADFLISLCDIMDASENQLLRYTFKISFMLKSTDVDLKQDKKIENKDVKCDIL